MNKIYMYILGLVLVVSGCATANIPPPTSQEREAARAQKKNITIVYFDETESSLRGVSALAENKIAQILSGHFNLITSPQGYNSPNQLVPQDKVDYLLYGSVITTISGPTIHSSESKNSKGKFSGSIWGEVRADAEISIRVVDARTKEVVYSETKKSYNGTNTDSQYFDDEKLFKDTLRRKEYSHAAVHVAEIFSHMDPEYSHIVTEAVKEAAEKFSSDFRRQFPQEGQILEIISDTKVMVNLGSAYGVRPGHTFIVWEESPEIRDSKTGISSIPKKKKFTLKVREVTSGITCIASSSKKNIQQLRVGDRVSTY